MKTEEGRYAVCDENRRAPDNVELMTGGIPATQYFGEDGECQRFDDLHEAIGFARGVWDNAQRKHLLVIRDKAANDKIVWTAEPVAEDPS